MHRRATPNLLYAWTITGALLLVGLANLKAYNDGYFKKRAEDNHYIDGLTDYELELHIQKNWRYEDVYFSFTYSIPPNPPMRSTISGKMVYPIGETTEMYDRFPKLGTDARRLLVIEKNNVNKAPEILEKEKEFLINAEKIYQGKKFLIAACPR